MIAALKSGATALPVDQAKHPQIPITAIKETNRYLFDGRRSPFGGRFDWVLRGPVITYRDEYRQHVGAVAAGGCMSVP